jgi:hypothetical protein
MEIKGETELVPQAERSELCRIRPWAQCSRLAEGLPRGRSPAVPPHRRGGRRDQERNILAAITIVLHFIEDMKRQHHFPLTVALSLWVSASVCNADLIAYWPFDEGEGTVAQDVIGGFDGAITGGTWLAPGRVGASAYQGTGGNEINCGIGASPTTADLTLAWWMIDNHASYGTIMDKSITGSGFGYNVLVRPRNEDSPLRFRIGGWQSYGGWGEECRVPPDAYADGEWVHIVCTFDSATDTASIYVNGELPTNGTFNPKTGIADGATAYCDGVNNVDTPLFIRGGEESFDGVLDEVAIWDQALTAEEVMAVFTGGPLSLDTSQPFAINSIGYAPGDNQLSLTWDSREGDLFTVKFSTDMIDWDSDLDDGIEADTGVSTTRTFDIGGLAEEGNLWLRVEKQ